jgi:hypothetical protein
MLRLGLKAVVKLGGFIGWAWVSQAYEPETFRWSRSDRSCSPATVLRNSMGLFPPSAGMALFSQWPVHAPASKSVGSPHSLQIPFFMIKQSNDMISLIDGHDQRL